MPVLAWDVFVISISQTINWWWSLSISAAITATLMTYLIYRTFKSVLIFTMNIRLSFANRLSAVQKCIKIWLFWIFVKKTQFGLETALWFMPSSLRWTFPFMFFGGKTSKTQSLLLANPSWTVHLKQMSGSFAFNMEVVGMKLPERARSTTLKPKSTCRKLPSVLMRTASFAVRGVL